MGVAVLEEFCPIPPKGEEGGGGGGYEAQVLAALVEGINLARRSDGVRSDRGSEW